MKSQSSAGPSLGEELEKSKTSPVKKSPIKKHLISVAASPMTPSSVNVEQTEPQAQVDDSDEMFERLFNLQGKQIQDQRADAELTNRTPIDRQGDSLYSSAYTDQRLHHSSHSLRKIASSVRKRLARNKKSVSNFFKTWLDAYYYLKESDNF